MYEPDGENPYWDSTWRHLGACAAPEPEDNRITLELPRNVEYADGQGQGEITGKLQCGADIHPFRGRWGETVVVNGLRRCNYVLIMGSNAAGAPMDTGRVLSLTEERGQNLLYRPRFRRIPNLGQFKALPGIKVELFAMGLDQPRQMALNEQGTVVYVGSSAIPHWADVPVGEGGTIKRRAQAIYALELDGTKTRSFNTYVIGAGLEEPHGVAYRNGNLYYTTTGGLMRISDVDAKYRDGILEAEKVWSFPADDAAFPLSDVPPWRWYHQKHPLHFNSTDTSDEHLYTAVGIPCNVCLTPADRRYGAVMRVDVGNKTAEVIARGVRNVGGFDWNPANGKIWFGDNNRDGFENADELNVIDPSAGVKHFGAPYVFGASTVGITQEEWDRRDNLESLNIPRGAILSDKAPNQIRPDDYAQPAHVIGSNFAPLGIKFWSGYPAPGGLQHMLTAIHSKGSDDRPGMNVMLLTLQGDTVVSAIPLIVGWRGQGATTPQGCMQEGGCLGSPVEFLVMPDGAVLISDDVAGMIYRVSYSPQGLPATALTLAAPQAPSADVADQRVVGFLSSPDGVRRDFDLRWGTGLPIAGLPYGDYSVEWKAVGNWVPQQRVMPVTISADRSQAVLLARYVPRPDVDVSLTLRAPARPPGAQAPTWNVVVHREGAAAEIAEVPWAGVRSVPVQYGAYTLNFPYTEKAYPSPMRQRFTVDDQATDVAYTTDYVQVEALGKHLVDDGPSGCTGCHSPDNWRDPQKAARWDVAGMDALISKVAGMSSNMAASDEHCDGVCAKEVAGYLRNVVWEPYLGSEDAFGPRQLRLLSRTEYVNSVNDVLGVRVSIDQVPQNKASVDYFYPSEARSGILAAEDVRRYYDVANIVGGKLASEQLASRYGATADSFIPALGRMLFRRTLTPAEVQRYRVLYERQENGGGIAVAMAMLVSPNFLYRSELGADAGHGVYTLTPYERASALSYALLGTTPDSALLAKAEAGELETTQQLERIALELLHDPRATEQIATFLTYYVGTPPTAPISPRPGLDSGLIQAMREEQHRSIIEALSHGSKTLDEIFNPNYTFLNQALAAHYGIAGVAGAQLVKKPLTSEQQAQRGGLLNSGLFAVTYANDETTSVILRGYNMRRHLFCQKFQSNALRPEPANFPNSPLTSREYWDVWTGPQASEGTCWGCHQYFNDAGATLENYDAAGRFRLTEKAINDPFTHQDVAINSDAPLISPFGGNWINLARGVRDISTHVPENPAALECIANGYYRFALGQRPEQGLGYKVIVQMRDAMAQGNGEVDKMIVHLMISGAMRERKSQEEVK
ncbi:DUF1592 domain-containing protein [Stenotrophomonas indicatrix]|uniref:DUF1592 domain-containing protein n=1 Tax=Stenotrophomonas indicatrix TaxID=2045451 RepID=UPI0030086117